MSDIENGKGELKSQQEQAALRKTQLEIEKLERECRNLDFQASKSNKRLELLKALSGIGSVLAAIFTLAAIIFSVVKWSDDNKQARIAKSEEKFNNLIVALQDQSPHKRLNAAITLRSFISPTDVVRNSQILISLTNALGFEEDEISRNGIVDVFKSLDFDLIDSNAKISALHSLLNLNRIIARSNDLFRLGVGESDSSNMKYEIAFKRVAGISTVIVNFLGKHIFPPDLSRLYFIDADFSNIKFPNGTNFTGSFMITSTFDSSTCIDCNFLNCNLNGSDFLNADLKGSKFGYRTELDGLADVVYGYKFTKGYWSPDFEGANLSKATFSNCPFLHLRDYFLTSPSPSPEFRFSPFGFDDALLDSTAFDNPVLFRVSMDKIASGRIRFTSRLPSDLIIKGFSDGPIDYSYMLSGDFGISAMLLDDVENLTGIKTEKVFSDLQFQFEDSKWQNASHSSFIFKVLKRESDDE